MTNVRDWITMIQGIVAIWANLMIGIVATIQLRDLKGIK